MARLWWLRAACLSLFTGEGQYGKVYTCINVDTGELMAMKEVGAWPLGPLCAGDLETRLVLTRSGLAQVLPQCTDISDV